VAEVELAGEGEEGVGSQKSAARVALGGRTQVAPCSVSAGFSGRSLAGECQYVWRERQLVCEAVFCCSAGTGRVGAVQENDLCSLHHVATSDRGRGLAPWLDVGTCRRDCRYRIRGRRGQRR
jgi:hypothetical protein